MRPKVFVSQPIPEPALAMLREVAEVAVFPRLDRNMSEDDNVILAPYNGGGTWDARGELTTSTARQIVALIAGERPAGFVED